MNRVCSDRRLFDPDCRLLLPQGKEAEVIAPSGSADDGVGQRKSAAWVKSASAPTAMQAAFDHFNVKLFGGRLPHCLLTLRSASRVYGYHHAGRFISPDGKVLDELGMHPGFFTLQPIESVMSTLVHEMTHHWQMVHFCLPAANC